MNHDEFAFFNQQLAAMLRDGIPLEGALKQLCAGMKSQPLRAEIERLEQALARGTPLKDAVTQVQLPELYRRMLQVGASTNDLPGVLTLLADHYQRAGVLWHRLKGLMVYPLLVIGVSVGLTTLLSFMCTSLLTNFSNEFSGERVHGEFITFMRTIWIPPILLALAGAIGVAAVSIPSWRARLRWHLPAFREASLAQLASAMSLMLRSGVALPEALALNQALESNSPAGTALAHWRKLIESGQGKPNQWPLTIDPFPPMFFWLVKKGGEDIAAGFEKAAGIFRSRASYRIEMVLYGALPISILLVGQMVFWQVAPLFRAMTWFMNYLNDF
jgi:type II secretory pathway component PulF